MSVEQHLSRIERKTMMRWGALGNKVPWAELKAILNDMGCYTEEINRLVAERALVRWVKTNQIRMRREIKEQTEAAKPKPEQSVVLPMNRELRRRSRLNEQLSPRAFVAAFNPAKFSDEEVKLAREAAEQERELRGHQVVTGPLGTTLGQHPLASAVLMTVPLKSEKEPA